MYCKYCGESISDDVAFCPICGTDQTLKIEEGSDYKESGKRKILSVGKDMTKAILKIGGEIAKPILEDATNEMKIKAGKSLQEKSGKMMHKAFVYLKIEKPTKLEKVKKFCTKGNKKSKK